ncbi:STAS domain-containing protein [Lentzea sp. NPDC042327]|uniref:STAS domain-containing protein n=1 Tax=Lentzea sp. NPDC042327 TaxID=3154801 RepID=UPI0033E06A20
MVAPSHDDAAPLTVEAHTRDGVPVLVLRGEIDLSNEHSLSARIGAQLESGSPAVLLDLRGVGYMGSAGLRVLVENNQRAEDMGVRLVVVADHSAVLRPIKITRLDQVLELHPVFPEPLHRA